MNCVGDIGMCLMELDNCLEFAETTEYNFVECGVAEGVTSFFILSEIDSEQRTN